jgi:hypothetical protein
MHMVDGIHQIGNHAESLLRSDNRKIDGKKSATEVNVDYKISLLKESLTTVTYNRAAKIESNDLTGVTDLRDLVSRLLERQGVTFQAAMDGAPVEIDDETRAEARALIADDGFWGIDQTSDRIFQMAVSNAGGDMGKFEQIKSAVEKGFDMAREALGGTLPDISLKTFDAVMEKLENWSNGGSDNG